MLDEMSHQDFCLKFSNKNPTFQGYFFFRFSILFFNECIGLWQLRPGHLLESKIRFQENRKMKKKLYEFSYQFQKYGKFQISSRGNFIKHKLCISEEGMMRYLIYVLWLVVQKPVFVFFLEILQYYEFSAFFGLTANPTIYQDGQSWYYQRMHVVSEAQSASVQVFPHVVPVI